jgi:hypothetical protein
MKSERISIILLFIFLILSISCNKQEAEWKGSIEKIDGVTVVKNPEEPMYGGDVFHLEEELVIGQGSEGPEEYTFFSIGDIAVDDEGNVYAADAASACIKVFDGKGRFLRTVGRKGQGPGEMQRPIFVQITSQRELLVGDAAFRFVFFSTDGEFLKQKATSRPVQPIKLDSSGHLIGYEVLAPPPVSGKIIRKYDADFKPSILIAEDEQGQRGILEIEKASCYCDVFSNDEIIGGDSKEYVLWIIDPDGVMIKKIVKDQSFLRLSENDREVYKERYTEAVQRGLKLDFPSYYPAFKDIFIDDKDKIFVRTFQRVGGEEGFFYHDVFDADGKYMAKVPVLANLNRNSVWREGKLYTVEEDEDGYQFIKRYKVFWNIKE